MTAVAANLRGFAIVRTGWAGTVTVDTGTPAVLDVTDSASAWSQCAYLDSTGPSWLKWDIEADGSVRLYHNTGTSFDLTFSTSALATRLGFSTTSYTGASEYTAESVAPGIFAPFQSDAGVYRDLYPQVSRQSFPLPSTTIRNHAPSLEIPTASCQFLASRAQALKLLEDLNSYLDAPARFDFGWAESTLVRHHASTCEARWMAAGDYATVVLSAPEVLQ